MSTPASPSILLLDDDPDVGLAAQLLLQRRVAPVACLRRPAELESALDRLRPSLLLLDMNFGPGRTDGAQGLRLLDLLATRRGAPPVIVMTAWADIDRAVQAVRRGAFDFVTKPWDNARLVAACREALASREPGAVQPIDIAAPQPSPTASLAVQERAALLAAMAESQGNVSAAARILGVSRAALYRRLDKHGL